MSLDTIIWCMQQPQHPPLGHRHLQGHPSSQTQNDLYCHRSQGLIVAFDGVGVTVEIQSTTFKPLAGCRKVSLYLFHRVMLHSQRMSEIFQVDSAEF